MNTLFWLFMIAAAFWIGISIGYMRAMHYATQRLKELGIDVE